ncbi:hypothetical protein SAMN04488540_11294 [Ferrimonas sediminum]|uniref:Uncharacterized protein n=1 Tax=Ferrimonas sediminum TaxID=718193 RepID=A0A1G8W4C7_9GAMM|nr:hypothetical protein [Ferrimonas sediminum]SDJ73211.1 hypothetical protein SAMN04488540_11294 [Ferrimonas sediminum]
MFEAMAESEPEPEPVSVGLACAYPGRNRLGGAVPLQQLSAQSIAESGLDLLLVCGVTPKQAEAITKACENCGCILAFVDSHCGDESVAWNVMANLKGKLEAHEMPANLGVADVRALANSADALLAFDCDASLFDFLRATPQNRHCGVIYLASGTIGLARYGEMNRAIAGLLSPSAYFVSSVYSASTREYIALVGVRYP